MLFRIWLSARRWSGASQPGSRCVASELASTDPQTQAGPSDTVLTGHDRRLKWARSRRKLQNRRVRRSTSGTTNGCAHGASGAAACARRKLNGHFSQAGGDKYDSYNVYVTLLAVLGPLCAPADPPTRLQQGEVAESRRDRDRCRLHSSRRRQQRLHLPFLRPRVLPLRVRRFSPPQLGAR